MVIPQHELPALIHTVRMSRHIPENAFAVVLSPVDYEEYGTKAAFILVPHTEEQDQLSHEAIRQTLEKISSNSIVWAQIIKAQITEPEENPYAPKQQGE